MKAKEIRDGTVEAGLEALCAIARPGECFTHREIATACGVSWQRIWQIEQKAMKTVRERLRRSLKVGYADFNLGSVR